MFDLVTFIKTIGYVGIAGIVFAETGLFIGFFLPGDSLLFTAGFLASQGFFDIAVLIFVAFPAAIAGDSFGYAFGRKVGPRIFTREDSLLFHKDHVERTRTFFERHGAKTIVLARFLPIVRTFAPVLAGVGKMHYPTFLVYNVVGAGLWAIGIPLAGYFLGRSIPGVDRYLIPIVLLVIILSVLPSTLHVIRDEKLRQQLLGIITSKLKRWLGR